VLGEQDVGHRVVVRRRIADQGSGPRFSDVLGELTEVSDAQLTVRTRDATVTVAVAEIERARRVPDRRRLSATERLELAAAAGWPAPVTGRLGDWLLRAAAGWTARANSALPVGDPGRPLAQALDAVEEWYLGRGLTPAVSTPMPIAGRVADALAARGWRPNPPTLVRTADLAPLTAAGISGGPAAAEIDVRPAPGGISGRPAGAGISVRLAPAPSEAWLAVVSRREGSLPEAARQVLTAVPAARFAEVHDGGALVAIGRGVVADPAGEWLGLSLVEVAPGHRRQGLAGSVVRELARWAVRAGATRAYLQVEADNHAAAGLCDRLGFGTHHSSVSWLA
jgi:GNAT superfamily N-acetyltransferase